MTGQGGPVWWEDGKAHLRAVDPVMAELIARYPDSVLRGRGKAMESLLRAVTGQQISVKAADAVWGRFVEKVPELTPEAVLRLSDDEMRACGFSGSKARYVRGIAQGFADGTVHPGLWDEMPEEAIIAELVKLPGIGVWTAEMFLIFHLMKPDVLPLGDLGLLKGFEKHYGPVRGTAKLEGMKRWKKIALAAAKHGGRWAPYRSLATWYLWRSLDPVEITY